MPRVTLQVRDLIMDKEKEKEKAKKVRNKRKVRALRDPTYKDADLHLEEVWIEHWSGGECLDTELYVNGVKIADPEAYLDSL